MQHSLIYNWLQSLLPFGPGVVLKTEEEDLLKKLIIYGGVSRAQTGFAQVCYTWWHYFKINYLGNISAK